MAYVALPNPKKNSLSTTIAAPGISDSDSTIPVAECAVFYDDAAALITEGIVISFDNATESASEEIKITGCSAASGAGNLTGATRGVSADGTNGAAASWIAGTKIAVNFTSTMQQRIKDDLDALDAPAHYIDLEADKWTVYTPLSMGGTGAEFETEQLGNGIERTYLGFGYASAQYAYLSLKLPADWDGANLTLQMDWETASADGNTCKMELYGARFADAATSDVAISTLLTSIIDTNTGAGQINQSAETSTFTITGTGNRLVLKITRDYTTDTLDADVKILGMVLKCIRTLA
jgi:hypothetical protein